MQNRDIILRNNTLLSGFMKVAGFAITFTLVPMTLGFLESEQYGIWMAMSSILTWITFFDVGLGNGMRNYLTQAISLGDYDMGRSYISTTFFFLTIIALISLIVSIAPLIYLDMNKVFNTSAMTSAELRNTLFLAILFTLLTFVVKNIGVIYMALQRYAINDFLNITGYFIILLIIWAMTKICNGSLNNVVLTFTAIPAIVFILASFPLFHRYPQLRPTVKSINMEFGKRIMNKGIGFFIIQITSCLIIFGASNLFIIQYTSPETVTVYNIAYKYFHLVSVAYIIVISPMWNAYTDAAVKGDYKWIKKTFHRSILFWGISIVACIAMLLTCPFFYKIWIGDQIQVPWIISFSVMLFIIFFNLNNGATYLLNGLNTIRVQIYASIGATLAYLLTIQLLGSEIGAEGIILCMAASYAIMSIIHLYQCHLLIQQKATGVWNK